MFLKASLKLLVEDFKKRGDRPHGKLLTLSRYSMGFDEDYFNRICQTYGLDCAINTNGIDSSINDEIVFNALGFEHLDTMDYSVYAGAGIIHDLNDTNIPKELENNYDFILDDGTIEHVFNFRNVLTNVFKMLKVGGTFFFDQPTFHGFNHGYYNFSPCLFYEYFKANNYVINAIVPYSMINGVNGFVYVADPVINDLYSHMPLIEGSINYVWGSVTKTSKTTFDITPQQEIPVKNWEAYNAINDVLEQPDVTSVYLYGTGHFAHSYLRNLSTRYRSKIAGLLSKDMTQIGQMFYGYKIYALEEVVNNCDVIIIATYKKFQETVYKRIKHLENSGIKIVRLHQ